MRISRPLCTALLLTLSAGIASAAPYSASIYRSQDDNLFDPAGADNTTSGYAVIHDRRTIEIKKGMQTYTLEGLTNSIDSEAIYVDIPGVSLVSQHLIAPQQPNTTLKRQLGHTVRVLDKDGKELAQGQLLQIGDNDQLTVNDAKQGVLIIKDYASVQLSNTNISPFTQLVIKTHTGKTSSREAKIDYPSNGLGWRAAYTAWLKNEDNHCQLDISAMASIANKTGMDLDNIKLKLIAGQPQFTQSPHFAPMMRAMAMAKSSDSAPTPEKSEVGDYHIYSLPEPLDLANNSTTQALLYAPHNLDCQQTWLFSRPHRAPGNKPSVSKAYQLVNHGKITSKLSFKSFDSFPAGNIRVLSADQDGAAQFIGEQRINDTAKDTKLDITLGQAFDLSASYHRDDFKLDKSARTLKESFRVTLKNHSPHERTIRVEDYAWRWHNWQLEDSNIKPTKTDDNQLSFDVKVPANSDKDLTYTLAYTWTQADE